MQKTTLKDLDDLIEIFPSMTMPQIIKLYLKALRRMKYYGDQIEEGMDSERLDWLLEKISFYDPFATYLGGYLARCYCDHLGYRVDC